MIKIELLDLLLIGLVMFSDNIKYSIPIFEEKKECMDVHLDFENNQYLILLFYDFDLWIAQHNSDGHIHQFYGIRE